MWTEKGEGTVGREGGREGGTEWSKRREERQKKTVRVGRLLGIYTTILLYYSLCIIDYSPVVGIELMANVSTEYLHTELHWLIGYLG